MRAHGSIHGAGLSTRLIAAAALILLICGCATRQDADPAPLEVAVERSLNHHGSLRATLGLQAAGVGGEDLNARITARCADAPRCYSGTFTIDEEERTRVIVDGDRAWVDVAGDELPGRARFVEVRSAELRELGVMNTEEENLSFLYLIYGAEDLRKRPTAADGGAATYEFTVDLEQALAATPPERRASVAQSFRVPEDTEIHGVATIDRSDYIQGLDLTAAAEMPGGDTASLAFSAQLSHYEAGFEIEPPAHTDAVPLSAAPEALARLVRDYGD